MSGPVAPLAATLIRPVYRRELLRRRSRHRQCTPRNSERASLSSLAQEVQQLHCLVQLFALVGSRFRFVDMEDNRLVGFFDATPFECGVVFRQRGSILPLPLYLQWLLQTVVQDEGRDSAYKRLARP